MEHDDLKELFAGVNPELTPSDKFITRVEHELDAVEFIRRSNAAALRRGRIALAVAALAGCATGFLLSLLMPLLGTFMCSLADSLEDAQAAAFIADHYTLIVWLLIGCISAIIAFNSYEFTTGILNSRGTGSDN